MTVVHVRGLFVAVLLLVAVGVAPREVHADEGIWGPSVPGQFIVELTADGDPSRVNGDVGGIALPVPLGPESSIWLFQLPRDTDPLAGTNRIKNTSGVVEAHPNVLAHLPEFYGGRRHFWGDCGPADPTRPASEAQLGQPGLGHAGLDDLPTTGAGVTIAVLDSGIAAGHPRFAGRIAPGGYDMVGNDSNPAEVANGRDDNRNGVVDEAYGHGTYVAALALMVAPDARVQPIRVLDSDGVTSSWRILHGLRRAAAFDADVVNLSLGGAFVGSIVERRIESMAQTDTIVVAAAGNEATGELRYPAAFDGVVAVTALDGRDASVADFANRGSWIRVVAPGVSITSAYPGGRYARWGGTSAAAPVTAGALALIREVMPAADVDDVIDRLTSTAIPDGLDNVSAYGRIDVRAAVERALHN